MKWATTVATDSPEICVRDIGLAPVRPVGPLAGATAYKIQPQDMPRPATGIKGSRRSAHGLPRGLAFVNAGQARCATELGALNCLISLTQWSSARALRA